MSMLLYIAEFELYFALLRSFWKICISGVALLDCHGFHLLLTPL